ncbi:3-oxoacyl-(acyl carrier protein) synthase I, partial [mine drainage metagenome]
MKRVVVTGIGIVSCLGNDAATVTESLIHSRSGIRSERQFGTFGLRSRIAGVPQIDLDGLIDRKDRRFMGDAAAYGHVAMARAIADSGLT